MNISDWFGIMIALVLGIAIGSAGVIFLFKNRAGVQAVEDKVQSAIAQLTKEFQVELSKIKLPVGILHTPISTVEDELWDFAKKELGAHFTKLLESSKAHTGAIEEVIQYLESLTKDELTKLHLSKKVSEIENQAMVEIKPEPQPAAPVAIEVSPNTETAASSVQPEEPTKPA